MFDTEQNSEKHNSLRALRRPFHLEQRHQKDSSERFAHNAIEAIEKPMKQRSAGILMYRRASALEVLLIHPGGPFWAKKDDGAWSIPKGLFEPHEEPHLAARREFAEETGCVPTGDLIPLGDFKPGAKILTVFAVEGDFDLANFKSNVFSMEWPPKSKRMAEFPEADRGGWFGLEAAKRKILKGQLPILDALEDRLRG